MRSPAADHPSPLQVQAAQFTRKTSRRADSASRPKASGARAAGVTHQRRMRANIRAGSSPRQRAISMNSRTCTRLSPASIFHTNEFERFSRAASWRCVNPAAFRASTMAAIRARWRALRRCFKPLPPKWRRQNNHDSCLPPFWSHLGMCAASSFRAPSPDRAHRIPLSRAIAFTRSGSPVRSHRAFQLGNRRTGPCET